MYRNQDGFSYPLTLTIILAALFLLTIQLDHFISEKRIVNQAETVMMQEYYLLCSLKKTEKMLSENIDPDESGIFSFKNGSVSYEVSPVATSLIQITFKTKIGSDKEIFGYAYYDTDLQKMIKWIEKN
ncbi:competence protein ComGG [Cytobacillus firmus]|uniref:Competence protein ComGG n=2 Tax=Cytobacillus TaxID=2675230 RepID=A0A366JNK8_CYTFI|nr:MULTISPECIES: competence type IV pilus minor pilin ComGG [Cytobacillus]RBP89415.1 competence protein ComGG [Cytobacillus firmus]TDX47358.1 competence protein ComGG [Cytobacillus oceanisediminis]